MRTSSRRLVVLALALALPIGGACAGNPPSENSSVGAGGEPRDSVAIAVAVGTGAGGFPAGDWSKQYGDAEDQRLTAFALDEAGEIALAGTVKGTIDFGNIPWKGSNTDTDVVVAKITREGQSLWSRRYGDSCDQHGGGVAHTPTGDVLLAGDFCGTMDFGTTVVATQGAEVDLFVALIDPLGEDVYSRSFGGKGAQIARGAAVDAQGNAVVIGSFDQAFDDGTGEKSSAGLDDILVIKLDAKGKLLWSRTFGGPESDIPRSVALDANANIVIGGSFGGSVDFGGGPLTAPVGHPSGFVLALDPDGNPLWSKALGGDTDSVVNAVAVGPQGTLAAVGTFNGTADFGGDPVTSMGEDAFLVAMDGKGTPSWSRTIGHNTSQRGTGVAFASNGDVAMACTSDDPFTPTAVGDPPSSLGPGVVLQPFSIVSVTYDGSGTPKAVWWLASTQATESTAVGLDPGNGWVLAGSFQKVIGADRGAIEAAGGWDMFVSHLP
jgi:hypothetical protein